MDQKALAEYHVGQSLDDLMNLDPRGYGVCRILYAGAREHTGGPLSINAARFLRETVGEGDLVYLFTGFVLLPHKRGEMDGVVGTVLLARALVLALGAKPVVICPADCLEAVESLARVAGLHLYRSVEEVLQYPAAMGVIPFEKDPGRAAAQAAELAGGELPAAMAAIEAPGANSRGVYHNATGLDVTELEAKSDLLYELLRQKGVPSLAVGDLGNEIGMGAIAGHIRRYVPYAGEGGCACGCTGGIAAASGADHILTATVSDWGCYAMIAALAYLEREPDILHDARMEEEAMVAASRSGMVDMTGWLVPAIDGFGLELHRSLVTMMGECVRYPLKLEKTCSAWFEKTLERGFFQQDDSPEGDR